MPPNYVYTAVGGSIVLTNTSVFIRCDVLIKDKAPACGFRYIERSSTTYEYTRVVDIVQYVLPGLRLTSLLDKS